ncbi:MAG: NADH-ubiquinone oxidoreductase subunit [Xanthobacteraceae bacterium]|jgi:multicomponent Na+:H+ antiporter subunit C|nr:NADH-ubiquinone oxidoreductase subunit [Xanthobacteraceae bacterium]
MSPGTVFGIMAAGLIGIGLFDLIIRPSALRKLLAFNIMGAGVFLLFGLAGQRGASAGFPGDPVPQAIVITGIVVAFAASALAIALLLRLIEVEHGDDAS